MSFAAALLRPALDALAPADPAAAHRRIRNFALWLAASAWMLPEFDGLGTGTTRDRAIDCAAFVAAAVVAHFARHRREGWRLTFGASALPALAVAYTGHGALWGGGFAVFAAATLFLNWARVKLVPPFRPDFERDPLPPLPGGVPRVLNALAWIGISVFTLQAFTGQAMVVPTGSMQPTIMGGAGRAPSWQNLGSPGDHLFVENYSYLFRNPGRFEIAVFEFPLFRQRYFVKRLVGLPGEHLEFKDGDLWIDGKVARKPPIVQATLWRELFPRSAPGNRPKAINEGFQQDVATGGDWKRLAENEVRCTPGSSPSFAFFNSKEPCPDVRLAFTAVPEVYGIVMARITSRGVPVTLRIDTAPLSAASAFSVGPTTTAEHSTSTTLLDRLHPTGGEPLRVELCVADGQAWALVDGAEVARSDVPLDGRGKNKVEIGAATKSVTFRDVTVARDIVYVPGEGRPTAYDIPADNYFFLGDNVAGSEDSRRWTVDVFHPPGGGAIRAADSYPDEYGNPQSGRIRVEGGMYRFLDLDGVARELPVAGTKHETGVPAPFVPRSHLVGRAVMVFWPILPTPDAGFRPRLVP